MTIPIKSEVGARIIEVRMAKGQPVDAGLFGFTGKCAGSGISIPDQTEWRDEDVPDTLEATLIVLSKCN